MKCPICDYSETKVIDSRVVSDGLSIRRRRECLKCGFRFSTYEEMEILDLIVVKRDGHKELYSRDKLISGLRKATEKRPVNDDQFKRLVNLIERDIQAKRQSEIESRDIGRIVMRQLKKVDKVAYIRFASVYSDFELQDLSAELNKLLKPTK
ncbi:MAG TPA: transcriptional regulator NrdR [bacterium]|jgi:transcriptional repressor NrdR|nr:MAG: Transcriptional repressor NrdR [Parcubacteria group bacterium ADurb.Bin016]HNQ45011.1 transcriptional regulator NrdR [bacterium]HRS72882.1 transcriptional regulator NrdR [Patescibacteria group bacterium]HNU89787.1 transcriptional regulator NrdR [bacterium]HOE80798.1 transcriptional regulator NrdR [bacterium]